MAEARTPPEENGEGRGPVRAFDRNALQATLADAVKLVTEATAETAAAASEAGAPPPRPAVTAEPAGPPKALPADPAAPRPAALRPPNPFSPGAGAEHPAAGRSVPPLSGVGRPVAPTDPPTGAPRPAPRLLGGGPGLASGGAVGGGLRPEQPPMPSLKLGGLGADRVSSDLAPGPAERPTIPLRRPKPADARAAAAGQAPPPAPAPQAAAAAPRLAAPIPAWSPSDDDILPAGPARRRTLRLKR